MNIRYLKVLRDIASDYTKQAMLVLAMGIGVFGIGCILGAYAVVSREMATNYRGTLPASATIEVDGDRELSRSLIDSVNAFPTIQAADRRATLTARMHINGKWYPLLLFVVDDFKHLTISKFRLVSGASEPPVGTLLAERTALPIMDAKEGGEITVKVTNGAPKSVRIVGTVHDPGLAPAGQEQTGYAYISLETLHWLGDKQGFDQLKLRVATNGNSAPHITEQARTVAIWLEKKGYRIHQIQVPPPNQHPHQGQMKAIMTIFIIFSFLLLILGSILVATSMATLMVKQVRQIGVMKTIGANARQIASLYLCMVLILCIVALLVSIPLSQYGASLLYTKLTTLLNLELTDHSIPYWVVLIQIGAGTLIPLMAVAWPVIRASRQSVRAALDNYGVAQTNAGNPPGILSWVPARFLGQTGTLALRNVFRQRSRLVMTLGLLAAGGAMFMTALNVSDAWDENLSRIYTQRLYDVEIRLGQPVRADALTARVRTIAGVKAAEAWAYASTSFMKSGPYEITHTYPDKGHGSFTIQALPVPTNLLKPTLVEGQWFHNRTANDVVLNQSARGAGTKIGDIITLLVEGKPTVWNVIGFTEDVGSPAMAYVSLDAFVRRTEPQSHSTMLRIAFADRRKAYAVTKIREVEKWLERDHIPVQTTIPVWLLHNAIAAHMKILVNTLMAMAILMALVGTLSLLSTMSMSVMERTREIGVMRAIGATPEKIRKLIVWEGLAIGGLSLWLAFLLSLGLSTYLGRFIGHMAFRTPLNLAISPLALVIWVGIVAIGSYLATLYPARRATSLTTREALAYE